MQVDSIFEDLLVVELASVLAGPAVGMFFAELGAKVIKIENKHTGGDVTRSWKHPKEDPNSKTSAYYHAVNYNKESRLLDLKSVIDHTEVIDVIRKADIVISNFKPGSDKKLGLDYDTLKALHPRLIHASISAYGPDDSRPGFDALIQAETGWMYMNGEAEGPPVKLPVALIDILAAHQLKEGVLVALIRRAKTGKGSAVHVSLYDTAIASLANQASNYLNVGVVPKRKGSAHPNIAPYGEVVCTADEKYFMLAVGTDHQFKQLCKLLSLAELIDDDLFDTNTKRVQNRKDLLSRLQASVVNISSEKFEKACDVHEVPVGKINDLSSVFEHSNAQELVLKNVSENNKNVQRVRTTVFRISE